MQDRVDCVHLRPSERGGGGGGRVVCEGGGRAERERRASSTLYMSPTGAADGGHYFMAGMQTTSPTLDAVGMLERVRGDGRG